MKVWNIKKDKLTGKIPFLKNLFKDSLLLNN